MCGGGGGDGGAGQARADEQARQGRISQGRQNIDNTFNSTYNDPYYANIGKSYTDYYNPQVDKQYGDAVKALTYKFGNQGILGSTAANTDFGKLEDRYNTERSSIANNSLQAEQSARSNVENERNQLYTINNSSADPAAAAASSRSALSSIQTQPNLSSLGNLFADFLNNAAAPASTVAATQGFVAAPGYNFSNNTGKSTYNVGA